MRLHKIEAQFDYDPYITKVTFSGLPSYADEGRDIAMRFNHLVGKDEDVFIDFAHINPRVKINRVVFEGKTTVLITDKGKYIATCEKGDKFDREKGLLVCLAKANGYSTSDILELLENANEKATKAEREKAKRRKK